MTTLVDDLAYRLSRFLIFLLVSQDSFAIPSIARFLPEKVDLVIVLVDRVLTDEARNALPHKLLVFLSFLSDFFLFPFI